uniref:Uncharacterized protein n=1 Tax=Cereibacter sphaeroides (strain ATCC 17025 / ATH 2.4.3) TaxID=349102 RepID=A4WTB5_CERS5
MTAQTEQPEYLSIRFRGDSETTFFAAPDPYGGDDHLRRHVRQHGFRGWVCFDRLTLNMQEVAAFFVSLGPSNPAASAKHEDRSAAAAPETAGTTRAFRYPKADPVQLYAITDIREPVFRMLVRAAAWGLDDLALEHEFGHETAAELTAILQQAREALGQ